MRARRGWRARAPMVGTGWHALRRRQDRLSTALEKIDFVDRGLRGRHADLLFSARMGEERLYVHTLIEEQRKVERLMILRFGVYMMRHWERLVLDQPTLTMLPAIVPILIHHSDTGWTAATAFEDIIETGERARAALLPHIPRFQMRLCDVCAGRPSGLLKEALTDLGRVVLWSLSVAHDDERLMKEIDGLAEELGGMLAAPDEIDAALAVCATSWPRTCGSARRGSRTCWRRRRGKGERRSTWTCWTS